MSRFKLKSFSFTRIKSIFAISLISAIAISFLAFSNTAYAFSGTGAGTSIDPYQITTCVQLAEIPDDMAASYLLMNSLDCESAHTRATDSSDGAFTGEFDGGEFDIALDVDTGMLDQAALFGNSDGALIKNVSVSGTLIGNWNSAGIVGSASNTTIENVTNDANITGGQYVGGIAGTAINTSITDSTSNGSVSSSTAGNIGGIVGQAVGGSEITSSISNSTVTAGGNNTGGLAGYLDDSTIDESSATGEVTGTGSVGGAVGYATSSTEISQSSSSVFVTGTGQNVGGFAGYLGGTTYESFATGNVVGGTEVGGFVGEQGGETYDSYARGNVTADDYAGGFVGYQDCGDNYRSYSTGTVVADAPLGGFIGEDDCGTNIALFWDAENSGIATSDVGTGKTIDEMKDIDTFTDLTTVGLDEAWDFAGIQNDDNSEGGE